MLSSQPVVTQRQRPSGLVDALGTLVVALVAGWFVVAWAIIRRPILSIPVGGFAGLCAWVGTHDAQALLIYAAVALACGALRTAARTSGWSVGGCDERGGVREPIRVRVAYLADEDIRAMALAPRALAAEPSAGPSPAARLQAALEGRGDGKLVLSPGQAAELDERRRAWGLPNRKPSS
jgi:hypothetical protein